MNIADRAANAAPRLILASQSLSRAKLLRQAGVAVEIEPAHLDEAAVKAKMAGQEAAEVALALAELKASSVSQRHPGALVIGADQILVCDNRWFDKPRDREECAAHLKALSGRRHGLETAVCVVRDGVRIWQHQQRPELTMRELDDSFINAYLETLGDDALTSVGGYQLEGLGAQLFTRVEGDFFSVLGLPLLPLLALLREHRVLPA